MTLISPCFFLQHKKIVPALTSPKVGILQFLPIQFSFDIGDDLFCRKYSLPQYELLEVIGKIPPEGISLDLLTANIGFWQIYLMVGSLNVQMPHNIRLSTNRCLSFSSDRTFIPLDLRAGYMRVLIIGYQREGLSEMLEEYDIVQGLSLLEKRGDRSVLPDVPIRSKVRAALHRIAELSCSPFLLNNILGILLAELLHAFEGSLKKEVFEGARSRITLYNMALEYIHVNYLRRIKANDIANALGISPRTLSRIFEDKMISISDYLHQLRMMKAHTMLQQGDVSIDDVAFLLNYPNRRYFSREFKKFFEQSPSEAKRGDDFFHEED